MISFMARYKKLFIVNNLKDLRSLPFLTMFAILTSDYMVLNKPLVFDFWFHFFYSMHWF
jgi:hypothetical protein